MLFIISIGVIWLRLLELQENDLKVKEIRNRDLTEGREDIKNVP